MFSVYVIYSKTFKLKYTGYTEDIERRLFEHNNGLLGKFTKNKGPWELIHKVDFNTRSEAIAHEKYLKSGKGRDFIRSEYGI